MSRQQRLQKMSRNRILTGPAQLKTNIEVKHQYRFVSSSANVTNITDTLISTAVGVSASTAILGHQLFECLKVNRIEIWSPPASQGAAVTCSVLFPAANQSQAREYTDTSVSVANPAHVVCTPPPLSLCAFWTSGFSGNTMFTLVAPPGSIIDLWVSLILNDPVSSNTATLVGATVGGVYYCSLDSATKAGSIYQSVGLTSL
jgi:hypothetical protein